MPKVVALTRAQPAPVVSAFFPMSHTASPSEERLPLASVPVITCIYPQLLSDPLIPWENLDEPHPIQVRDPSSVFSQLTWLLTPTMVLGSGVLGCSLVDLRAGSGPCWNIRGRFPWPLPRVFWFLCCGDRIHHHGYLVSTTGHIVPVLKPWNDSALGHTQPFE